jgi:hypothetical protein
MNPAPIGSMRYLAQDVLCNGAGQFVISLHSIIFPPDLIPAINDSLRYETISTGVLAVAQETNVAVLVHCKCKHGVPEESIKVGFQGGTSLHVSWTGARRIFVRVRIMESTTINVLMDMLRDDIQSGHSVSDVENPDSNQSFRPWSDQDDSETDTLDEDEE